MAEEFSIKEVILRMEKNTEDGIKRVEEKVDTVSSKLEDHMAANSLVWQDVSVIKNKVEDHHTVLYDPNTGLIYRMKTQEEWANTQRKVLWEIAKPGLGMLGALLLIGLGMLAILGYGLQILLQSLAP